MNTSTCNASNDSLVQIYRRIFKYSPFANKKRSGAMKIEHHLKNGSTITATATSYVTVEDAEKLFTLIYVMQTQQVEKEEFEWKGISVIATTLYISDIAKILNTHNYNIVISALERITKLTLHYPLGGKIISTHIVHEIQHDPSTCKITVLLNLNFYRACRNKYLRINLQEYLSLRPTAKNLYAFLKSNPSESFSEELLFERAVIHACTSTDKRKQLIKSLKELKGKKHILNFRKTGKAYAIKQPKLQLSEFSPALPNRSAGENVTQNKSYG